MSENKRELQKAKLIAFRLLKIRGRSEEELKERLRLKNIQSDIINETLGYLKILKLIDDQKFAKDWIHARLNRPFGLRRISIELKRKGISPEIITRELNQARINYEETDIVETLAKQRAIRYTDIDQQKRKKRVFDYLARRGFSLESIQKVIKKL